MSFKEYYNVIFGIVGALAWIAHFKNWGVRKQLVIPNESMAKPPVLRNLLFILGILSWISISFSLMLPRKAIGVSKSKTKVNDIFFVIDVSRSMLANDFAPNRLEAAKRQIASFVDLRPKDRIGLVMFSEKAYTLLPLSIDLKLVRQAIDGIKIGPLGSGTNIGDALGLAVARGIQSLADNKIIILLTDGVSNVGSLTPIQASEYAKDHDMRVYTIGIGGDKNAQIPIGHGAFGQRYQTIPGGSIDTKTLKEISAKTDGEFFLATDEDALNRILENIDQLERTDLEISGKVLYKEYYFPFLIFGVLILFFIESYRRFVCRELV